MNTKNVVIASIVILILVVFGWYAYSQQDTQPAANAMATTSADSMSGDATAPSPGPVSRVVNQGGNYVCTLSISQGSSAQTGTIYSAGGKSLVEFEVKDSDGTVTTAHIIRSGGYAYTWLSGQTTGIRKSSPASSPFPSVTPTGATFFVDAGSAVATSCRPWFPNQDFFTLPSTVTFSAQ